MTRKPKYGTGVMNHSNIFRVTPSTLENWSVYSRKFFDPCKASSNKSVCKTEVLEHQVKSEKLTPSTVGTMKTVMRIDRYNGDYLGWIEFEGDTEPYEISKGTCTKIASPELDQRKF